MKKSIKIILVLIIAFAVILVSGYAYLSRYSPAIQSEVDGVLNNPAGFSHEERKKYIGLIPDEPSGASIIFYPGGNVDERAYIPMLAKLAKEGVGIYIIKMPFKLAVFNINGANDVLPLLSQDQRIYLAGHSLGGAMVSVYGSRNADDFEGIILLGSYSTSDISDTELKAITIAGTEDDVLNRENFEKYMDNLPSDVVVIEIEGGNHAYFGNYGEQKGDGKATISRREQQEISVGAILDFVHSTSKGSFDEGDKKDLSTFSQSS